MLQRKAEFQLKKGKRVRFFKAQEIGPSGEGEGGG